MIDNPKTAKEFISGMSTCAPLVVAPDIGVRKGYEAPCYSHEGALAEMMQPANCPVPATKQISESEINRLGAPARPFFQNIMRPIIKHV